MYEGSSDSSEGDDILIFDSSEIDEEEEEDSENSDEEKSPTQDSDSLPRQVRNKVEMHDSAMYDLSEESVVRREEGLGLELGRKGSNGEGVGLGLGREEVDFEDYDEDMENYEVFSDYEEEKTPIPGFWFSTEVRNWLEMPQDVMSLIFTKVGAVDILLGAQYVCTAWQKLSKEPQFYRIIDLRNIKYYDLYIQYDPVKLAICAVNRSAGQLVEFSVKAIATEEMLKSITKIRSPLKCLRFVECDLEENDLMLLAKKLPLLEELEILHSYCCKSMIKGLGRYCLKLKSFRLTCEPERFCEKSNGQAFAIALNMPSLHHLDLFGNPLTDRGLIAILDHCLHLKSLDCRRCFRLGFGEDLFKRCTDRNIDVKLPGDCVVGCGFDTSQCDRPIDLNYFWDKWD